VLSTTALKDFGYYYLSPLLSHYFQAVVQRLGPDTRVVCLAREGYLFRKVLLALASEGLISLGQDPLYLQVSRVVLHKALFSEADILANLLKAKFQGSFGRLLTGRFGLPASLVDETLPAWEKNSRINLPDEAQDALTLILRRLDTLAAETKATRSGLDHYFSQCGLRTHGGSERLLLLDLGYSGTIQKLLTRMLARDTEGLYIMASSPGRHKIGDHWATMDGTLATGHEIGSGFTPLDRSLFYECLITAPHGQVLDVLPGTGSDCHFVYGGAAAGQRYLHSMEALHSGAVQGVVENFRHGVQWSTSELLAMADINLTKSWAIPGSVRLLFSTDDSISGNGFVSPLQLYCM